MFWAANANVKVALRIHKKCHFSHSFEQASRYAPKFKMADAWPSSHTVDAAVILTEGLSQERSHCGINRQSSVSTDNTTIIPPGNKHLHRVITWVAFKPWNSLRSSYATAHAQSQYPLQFRLGGVTGKVAITIPSAVLARRGDGKVAFTLPPAGSARRGDGESGNHTTPCRFGSAGWRGKWQSQYPLQFRLGGVTGKVAITIPPAGWARRGDRESGNHNTPCRLGSAGWQGKWQSQYPLQVGLGGMTGKVTETKRKRVRLMRGDTDENELRVMFTNGVCMYACQSLTQTHTHTHTHTHTYTRLMISTCCSLTGSRCVSRKSDQRGGGGGGKCFGIEPVLFECVRSLFCLAHEREARGSRLYPLIETNLFDSL